MKKILGIILIIVMLLQMAPITVFAVNINFPAPTVNPEFLKPVGIPEFPTVTVTPEFQEPNITLEFPEFTINPEFFEPIINPEFTTINVTSEFYDPNIIPEFPTVTVTSGINNVNLPNIDSEFVSGEIVVKFKNGVENTEISKINSRYGLSIVSSNNFAGFQRLKIPQDKTVSEMVDLYMKDPNVEYAEPNYIAHACMVPNDPYYIYQWDLHDLSEGGINMEPAWDIATGSSVVVAIIDSGIRVGSDLSGTCFVPGYDFVNYDNDPTDDYGHGTHVAGTVAQRTNNNQGVAGVAFNACLMPVKVLDDYGSGYYSDIADGIYYAVDHGANIISMSLGGSSSSNVLKDALAYAYNHGVTCVAAAGNGGKNGLLYPAAYDAYVIAVGATQFDKTKAPYSNYGSSLDLVAPGGNTALDQNWDGYDDGILQQTFTINWQGQVTWDYYLYQGTSMATPHVSGVAALLYSKGVTSPDDIRNVLQSTAVDLGSSGWDMYYGYGLVNAYNALQYISGDKPPSISITQPANGATVAGNVNIQANASDDNGVLKVDFYIDSLYLGNDTTKPYSWLWGSNTASEGSHIIKATAIDTANQSKSSSINIIVDNINDPPVANAGPDKSASINNTVRFNGSSSYDPDGSIISYYWDFGDGAYASGVSVSHVYSAVGTYTVSLTVTDNDGATNTDAATVIVKKITTEIVELYDSFEIRSKWNVLWVQDSQNGWYRSMQRATNGWYSAEIDGPVTDATLTLKNAINLSGKSSATLNYSWFIEKSWDTGEYIALDVYDGTWHEVSRLRGNVDQENVWYFKTIDLTPYMTNNFKIRFRAKVSHSIDDGDIDNVKIVSVL